MYNSVRNIIKFEGGDTMKYTLKELRARKNKTQQQVAEGLGVSTTTYNAWEQNISNVAVSKVQAVAKYFGVTLNDLFFTPQHEYNSCEDVETYK